MRAVIDVSAIPSGHSVALTFPASHPASYGFRALLRWPLSSLLSSPLCRILSTRFRLPQVEVSPTFREHFVNIREVLLISACYHSWRALTAVVESLGLINEKTWIAEEQSQSQN